MNQNQSVDYTDLVIMDMYEILTTHKQPWPKNFTRLKKLEFLDKIMDYLTQTQRYEQCKVLTELKERIMNEPISKSKEAR